MSKVVVFTNVTLDGVMQAPGRPDEDRRGGFEHGGWAAPYAAMQHAGTSMAHTGALLLGPADEPPARGLARRRRRGGRSS
jgi:hypothetical protein